MSKANSALFAAVLLALGAGAGAAAAQTPSAADGATPDGKGRLAVCKSALDQLCATVEKGGGRKLKCLKDNEAKLTPECKTALDAAIAARAEREAKGAAPAPAAAPAQK